MSPGVFCWPSSPARSSCSSRKNGTNCAEGTAAYTPPEQWEAATDVGPAADIYAFGLILSDLLADQHALLALTQWHSPFEWKYAHQFSQPRRLRDVRPEIPEAIEDLYLACLAKDPAERPTARVVLETFVHAMEALQLPIYRPDFNLFPRTRENAKIYWLDWGSAYARLGYHEEGLIRIDKAYQLAPSDLTVLWARRDALEALGRITEALAANDAMETMFTQSAYLEKRAWWRRRALLLKKAKRDEEAQVAIAASEVSFTVALKMFDAALRKLDPEEKIARKAILNQRGNVLSKMQSFAEADMAFAEALRLMPYAADSWFNRALNESLWGKQEASDGNIAEALAHFGRAITHIAEALRINPDFAGVQQLGMAIQRYIRMLREEHNL
jgi:tetratricopeptide (TPR) repeat protein